MMKTNFDKASWKAAAATANLEKPKIAFVGFAGSGKSMMVNSLFGEKIAAVNARAGWTTVPQFVEHELFELIDTPGFGSDGWEDRLFVEQILEPADLVIHLINAASGLTDYDRDMFELVSSHPGFILVLNKVDLLDEDEETEASDGILNVLPIDGSQLMLASGKMGTGLPSLVRRMTFLLPQTMKTSFVGALSGETFTEERVLAAKDTVHYYAGAAGLIGCIPIPIADIAALAPLQVAMFLHISRIFGHQYSKEQASSVVGSLLGSIGARSAAQAVVSVLKGIPGIGTVLGVAAGAAIATTTFEAFGNLVIHYFKQEQKVSPEAIKSFYKKQYDRAKSSYSSESSDSE